MRRRMVTGLTIVAAAYLVLVALVYLLQRRLLYFPDTSPPDAALAEIGGLARVTARTADGLEIASWHRPPPPGAPVVFYFHGNGGHAGYRARRARAFVEAGFGVVLVGYRGYGGNPGSPTEAGLLADGRAALARVAGPSRVVLYGESLGSGVAVRLAAETPVAAVVLEAPFTSVADVAQHHYPFLPVRWLAVDRFDSLAWIAAIGAPLLVIHGERDAVVPVRYGRALFGRAAEPKEARFFPEAGHEDLYSFGAFDAVRDFIARRVGP